MLTGFRFGHELELGLKTLVLDVFVAVEMQPKIAVAAENHLRKIGPAILAQRFRVAMGTVTDLGQCTEFD